PVAADDAPHQSLVGQMIRAARLAIALTGTVNECQRSWLPRGQKALFQGDEQRLGNGGANKTTRGNRLSILDELRGFRSATQLVLQRHGITSFHGRDSAEAAHSLAGQRRCVGSQAPHRFSPLTLNSARERQTGPAALEGKAAVAGFQASAIKAIHPGFRYPRAESSA